ncbi:MAG TPA: fibronectin type III domain-containing protein [Verrucomicrobiae bacterium]
MRKLFKFWIVAGILLMLMQSALWADDTFVYAVQISATVETNPPSITLSWAQDPFGAKSYAVFRKSEEATAWGSAIANVDGSITNFTDSTVEVGETYEYQVTKNSEEGYIGYGYIYSGIQAPLIENRGTLVLVVATNSAIGLDDELSQLQSDLIGDGWNVISQECSSNDTPQYVRSLITNVYYADPMNVNAVFLFGHVPVLESGNLNYDGHYTRSMPADTYYGEMKDDWTVPKNPTNGPSYIPSDVVLEVGRVDMFGMIGQGALSPWPSEQDLLRNYLNKNHNWRNHLIPVQRRALMGDRRGVVDGSLAMAASGYRVFQPLVGPGNIVQANIQDNAPVPQRWISMLGSGNYLWSFGDGGGEVNGVTYLGTNGQYNEVLSTDIVGVDAQAVFVMLFGSFMGNWNMQDDVLRSVLATPTMGLACCMSGEPHWFLHHMGLGETIGYGTRLTMNNSTLYKNASNAFTRAVFINLMGDPSLREDPINPPSGLNADATPTAVTLTWSPGFDPVLGYNLYRSASPTGPYSRLNDSLVLTTNYLDSDVSPDTYTYMVRAVRLETTPSGSYYNASEGVMETVEVPVTVTPPPPPPPISVAIAVQPAGFALTWNSVPGTTYRVLNSSSLSPPIWTDISGTITATDVTTSWNTPGASTNAESYYTISSP